MKLKKSIIGLFALVGATALAGCSNDATSNPGVTSTPVQTTSEPEETSTTKAPATFEAYTLSQLHDARVAKTLGTLDQKTVSIKGKVTFVKRVADYEDDSVMFIQNGKYAVEVSYPTPFEVNVGDSVEVKGELGTYTISGTVFIKLYVNRSMGSNYDVKVINESITVEDVTITKEADLLEYNASKANIDFTVTGNRTNAAFVGKLSDDTASIIVANKSHISEKFDSDPYVENDEVRYSGVFTYSGNESTKVLRYYDRAGFSKKN